MESRQIVQFAVGGLSKKSFLSSFHHVGLGAQARFTLQSPRKEHRGGFPLQSLARVLFPGMMGFAAKEKDPLQTGICRDIYLGASRALRCNLLPVAERSRSTAKGFPLQSRARGYAPARWHSHHRNNIPQPFSVNSSAILKNGTFVSGARAGCAGLRFATVLYHARGRHGKGTRPFASHGAGIQLRHSGTCFKETDAATVFGKEV